MHGIFDYDGFVFRLLNLMYCLIIANLLWVVFSIPIFTVGASTTALFSVIGKIAREEGVHIFRDFMKSFRMKFRQSTFMWLILFAAGIGIYFNIKNIYVYGKISGAIFALQMAALIELIIIFIYIFPLISAYNMKLKELIRISFIIGNRFILHTLLCMASFLAVIFMIYKVSSVFILALMSIYAYSCYYIMRPVFKKFLHS